MQKYMCVANMCTISICDQVCKNRSYLHIQFCDFEDTELSLWVSYRYTNLTTINDANFELLAIAIYIRNSEEELAIIIH